MFSKCHQNRRYKKQNPKNCVSSYIIKKLEIFLKHFFPALFKQDFLNAFLMGMNINSTKINQYKLLSFKISQAFKSIKK